MVVRQKPDFQLRLSISDSIVSSTSHALNVIDISDYEYLTINMLIKPSLCTRKPYQKAIIKHHYNLKSLNITPIEIDYVK